MFRIKLFKKKRIKKFGSYLAELIIVVLGVTIAFQLNVWNDSRKEARMEVQLLDNFIAENNRNRTEIDSAILRLNESIEASVRLIDLLKDTETNDDTIRVLLARQYQISWPDLGTTHLENYLDHTADLTPLREELLLLNGHYLALDDLIKTYINQKQVKYFDYLADAVDMTQNLDIVDKEILFSVRFRNNMMIIAAYETTMSGLLGQISTGQQRIDSLLIIK